MHAAPGAMSRGRCHSTAGGAGSACAAVFSTTTTRGPRSFAQTMRAYSA